MLKLFKRQSVKTSERGQSLVEMTIIVPLLLLMFLGLIEVGWAIRGYMVLLSTNREMVRFAARGEYLDFGGVIENAATMEEIQDRVGYGVVKGHTGDVLLSNQLGLGMFDTGGDPLLQPLDDASQGSVMITHIFIDTGLPCRPEHIMDTTNNPSLGTCLTNPNGSCETDRVADYPYDDVILVPARTGYEHFFYQVPFDTSYTSRLDLSNFDPIDPNLSEELQKLKEENDRLNCEIQRRSPYETSLNLSVNSIIIGEAFYDQPQLLGMPFLSNTFTDPIPLSNQTKMRITSDSLPQGGICQVLPIAVQEDMLYNDAPTNSIEKSIGTEIQIRQGGGSGNFGWLKWNNDGPTDPDVNANTNSEQYLASAIVNPNLSVLDYENAINETDHILDINDWIWGSTGQIASQNVIDEAIGDDIPRTVTLPVWDIVAGVGSSQRYHIVGFALVRITGLDFQGSDKWITGDFMGWDLDCPQTDLDS